MPTAPYSRARDLHVKAVQLYNRGRPAQALATLQRARTLLDSDAGTAADDRTALAARIWISIALNEAEVHTPEAGFAALRTAQSIIGDDGDPALLVLLHCQRGLIELRGGSLSAARQSLDAAVDLLAHAEPRERASILLNRGNVALAEGRLLSARADFERAAAIAHAGDQPVERFKSLHNLAYVQFLLGDLATALRSMSEAQHIDLGQEWGIVHLDRARILSEAGLAAEADESLSRAAAIFRRERAMQDLAETELERARCALALGDLRSTRRFAGSARRRWVRRGTDRWRRSAELVLLQADLAAGRGGATLTATATALAAEFDAAGLSLHTRVATLLVAEAALQSGDPDAAARALAGARPARADDPVTGRMHFYYVQARVDADRGERVSAARRVRRALDEMARYQASFGSIDLRTAAAVHGRRLAALDIALAAESGRPAAVFAAAERARAVSSRLPPVRPPDDPVSAELLAELRQTIESLRAVEQDRAASAPLLRRRRELERKIVERSWTVSGRRTAAPVAALSTVRAELDRGDRTMITYVHVDDRLSAVVVGKRVRLIDLGPAARPLEAVRRVRADLDVLGNPSLPAALRAAVRASLHRSLDTLDAVLVAPLRIDGPLVAVTTGVLGQLPWAALPSMRGRPVEVVSSATKWLTSAQARADGTARIAALAGPGLLRAGHEVTAVGAAWPDARVDPAATAATLLDAARTSGVLHVAAHGVHQPENPLFSSLRMVDGPVFAHELHQAGTAPEHVVLSACEVGLATIRPGDEALGLASVLLGLGTRSVIASVARVGDGLAERTMAGYHQRLAAGADSALALADALAAADSDVVPPFVNFGASWRHPSATDLAGGTAVT